MRGITITDSIVRENEGKMLAFDLRDILGLFEQDVRTSEWKISSLECLGSGADDFYEIADKLEKISGDTLLLLAKDIVQIVDGEFSGYKKGENLAWIIIRAVDSSAYDILSENELILSEIKNHFRSITDYPDEF